MINKITAGGWEINLGPEPNRIEIKRVGKPGSIDITANDEGFVVDVWPTENPEEEWPEPAASSYCHYQELEMVEIQKPLEPYAVLYFDPGQDDGNDPLVFLCSAEDEDHAHDQCKDANPDCQIVYTGIHNSKMSALLYYNTYELNKSEGHAVLYPYTVLMQEPKYPAELPIVFHCQATDTDDAKQQAKDNYDLCEILELFEGTLSQEEAIEKWSGTNPPPLHGYVSVFYKGMHPNPSLDDLETFSSFAEDEEDAKLRCVLAFPGQNITVVYSGIHDSPAAAMAHYCTNKD